MKTSSNIIWLIVVTLVDISALIFSSVTKSPELFAASVLLLVFVISVWIDTIQKMTKVKEVIKKHDVIIHHYQLGDVILIDLFGDNTARVKSMLTNRVYDINLKDTDH